MERNSAPKIYGVLGYPAKHSLSPAMHNAAFQALEIKAEYRYFEIKPEELKGFLDALSKNNIWGLNVTIPYKEKVLAFVSLDKESSYLRQLKAVNTIVKKEGGWQGFNTDIPGFSRHLKEQINPANKRAAILGAGGAGRSVAYALANSGAKEIVIFDIDSEKSKNASSMVKSIFPGISISCVADIEKLDLKDKDLFINCTPIGMKEQDPCLIKEDRLQRNIFVYDLIYNPPETKLLALAKKIGAKASNGLGMLLYQGALSFGHFTGQDAPIAVMRQALEEAVKKL